MVEFTNTVGEAKTGILDVLDTHQQLPTERWNIYNVSIVEEGED